MAENKNFYIDSRQDFDVDKAYDEYAKEVLARKGYPLRAEHKAEILYDFASPVMTKISTISDIGGCYGYCLNHFQQLYKKKKGAETSGSVYELGQEYLVKGPELFPKIRFIHSDKLGFEKYDLVLACDVLEHVVEYDKFIKKIKNISKKYVLVWSPLELTLFRKILIRLRLLPKIKWGRQHPEKHVNFWGEKETRDMLKRHFKILKIEFVTGREMAEGYGREVVAPKKSPLVKIFYPLVKYIPDYFYIKLIGGNMIILCEKYDAEPN